MDPNIERKIVTGQDAASLGWVMADARKPGSASSKVFACLNDHRYEVRIHDKIVTASDVVVEMTAEVSRDTAGRIVMIENKITGISIAGHRIPLGKKPMIGVKDGSYYIGKATVTITVKSEVDSTKISERVGF